MMTTENNQKCEDSQPFGKVKKKRERGAHLRSNRVRRLEGKQSHTKGMARTEVAHVRGRVSWAGGKASTGFKTILTEKRNGKWARCDDYRESHDSYGIV